MIFSVPSVSSVVGFSNLFHKDLRATWIERALYAHALAFELLHVVLVVDVVGFAAVIFQHVLVAVLLHRAGEYLAV